MPDPNLKTYQATVAVDASGDATAYIPTTDHPIKGWIVGVRYTKVDYANGVDFTITTEDGGLGVWTESDVNASDAVYPSMLENDLVGGARATTRPIPLANERLKIVIASGGVSKSGTFTLVWEGS